MAAIVEQRKTGYYVTLPDGSFFADADGHMWFSRSLAAELARERGGWYEQGQRGTIKDVVTGYTKPAWRP